MKISTKFIGLILIASRWLPVLGHTQEKGYNVRLNTIAIMVHKKALPKAISRKLDL